MRTGRLSISRGHEIGPYARAANSNPGGAAGPVSFRPARPAALDLIELRINALERLSILVDQGILSLDEFKIEKALVLRHTGGQELPALKPKTPARKRRSSKWRWFWLAPPAALGMSYWLQPDLIQGWLVQLGHFVTG